MQVSLHREPPEVGLVEKVSGSLYWWALAGSLADSVLAAAILVPSRSPI